MVRKWVQAYRDQTGYSDQSNFYSPPVSGPWQATPDEEKIRIMTQAIEKFSKERKVDSAQFVIKEIQREFKVVLSGYSHMHFSDNALLLELETYLREKVERTLCIHQEEEPDKNKMRWDRPAVKSQVAVPKKVVNLGGKGEDV